MHDKEVDSGWNETDITADQVNTLLLALALLQEYSHTDTCGNEIPNYDQREWRLPIDVRMKGDNFKLNDAKVGDITLDNVSGHAKDICYALRFSNEDIDFIVVPRQYEKLASSIAKDIGCTLKVYEGSVVV